jgi:phosphate transport system substrate-binding protein
MKAIGAVGLGFLFCLFNLGALEAQTSESSALKLDAKLPVYTATTGVSGNIKSVGSDTMNNLMTLWAEAFQKFYPNIQVEIEGKGSATAPAALIAGTATFGPMSREMKAKEADDFEKQYGYKPVGLGTSIDMLAVYVHKDNPIEFLTMAQVDAIFSKTRKRGLTKDIKTWGDLGLKGEWANRPIQLYGRNSASGTYGYFKEHALSGGDFKDEVKEQPGSSSVVQGVASEKGGIGYSGIGYKTADVKAVPLKADDKSDAIPATPEFAYTGKYPLARFLFVYVNYKPKSQLDPLRREFIKYVFSQSGQRDVIKDGYFPINSKIAEAELKKVGLSFSSY